MLHARYAWRDSRWAWFRLTPVMPGVIPDARATDRAPVVQMWYAAGVVGTCHAQSERRRPERRTRRCSRPLRARDPRFFEVVVCSALAAAERQSVGSPSMRSRAILKHSRLAPLKHVH